MDTNKVIHPDISKLDSIAWDLKAIRLCLEMAPVCLICQTEMIHSMDSTPAMFLGKPIKYWFTVQQKLAEHMIEDPSTITSIG